MQQAVEKVINGLTNNCLTELDLKSMTCDAISMQTIIQLLIHNTSLEKLIIGQHDDAEHDVINQHKLAILESLQKHPRIRSLIISSIWFEQPKEAQALQALVATNPHLAGLFMHYCGIAGDAVSALSNGLTANKTLKRL